jgi:hypothetical protein
MSEWDKLKEAIFGALHVEKLVQWLESFINWLYDLWR